MTKKSDGQFNTIKKIAPSVVTVILIALLLTESVFAWFSRDSRYSKTDELEIGLPPIIYLKDDNLNEMTTFHLDGLKIGIEYNFVFCVAPALQGSVKDFFLGLVFTENMGMDINVYPVSEVTLGSAADGAEYSSSDINDGGTVTTCYYNFYKTNDKHFDNEVLNGYTYKTTYGDWKNETPPSVGHSLNSGIYKSYDKLKFSDVGSDSNALIDRLNDTSRLRFFVLNITWAEHSGTDNIKETDIVYIVSRGTGK